MVELQFERVIACGDGKNPAAYHSNRNKLQILYLDSSSKMNAKEATPPYGNYSNLVFTDNQDVTDSDSVRYLTMKKSPHFGGFGYWIKEQRPGLVTNALYSIPVRWKPSVDEDAVSTEYDSIVIP